MARKKQGLEDKIPVLKPRSKKSTGKGGNGRDLHTKDNGGNDDAMAASFLQHNNRVVSATLAAEEAKGRLKKVLKDAQDEGFSKRQFQIAAALNAGDKREFKVRTELHDRLQVAKWIGHPIAKKVNLNQLDLFGNVDAPTGNPEDSAYDAGKQAGLEGRTADVPGQYSGAELSQAWLSGWHLGQESIAKGIKPLEAQ